MNTPRAKTDQSSTLYRITVDPKAAMWVFAAIMIQHLPEVVSKLMELTDNAMKNGYEIRLKVGTLDFSLEKG